MKNFNNYVILLPVKNKYNLLNKIIFCWRRGPQKIVRSSLKNFKKFIEVKKINKMKMKRKKNN
jgi:hypothetical protein